MANLALNRPRRSRFASPLQLSFEPILIVAHLLAQPNYGDNNFIKTSLYEWSLILAYIYSYAFGFILKKMWRRKY
jgi:hypothetical protein